MSHSKKSAKKAFKEKAGAVVYKNMPGDEPQVLLVSARKLPGFWVFPVGSVEKGESPKEAAERECREESGYCISIDAMLTTVEFAADDKTVRFAFYMATPIGETEDWEKDRSRRWVPLSQVASLLPDVFKEVAHAAARRLIPEQQRPAQMTLEEERQRLKELLLTKSCRKGTFTLTSGKISDFYIDGKQTTLDAEGCYLCGRLLFELIRQSPRHISGVGGMTLGADPLVTAVAMVSHLAGHPIPAFIVRKEAKGHGTGNFLEGKSNLEPGCSVALLEDVVTTGGTLLKVIERVEKEGFQVALVATVVDREEGGGEILAQAGYPLHAVFTRTQLAE